MGLYIFVRRNLVNSAFSTKEEIDINSGHVNNEEEDVKGKIKIP